MALLQETTRRPCVPNPLPLPAISVEHQPMKLFSPVLIFVCLLGCPFCPAAQNADQTLDTFFNQYLQQRFVMHPLEATELGDHHFDDRLDDLTPAALDRSLAHVRSAMRELPRHVRYRELSRAGQIDYDILAKELQRSAW